MGRVAVQAGTPGLQYHASYQAQTPGLLPGSQIALPALPAAGSEAGLEADR